MRYLLKSRLLTFLVCMTFLVAGLLVVANYSGGDALAGASIQGDPAHSNTRALISVNGSSKVLKIVYFNSGSKTNPGANTPVASGSTCSGSSGLTTSGTYHYAEVRLVGTLAGTNPTLTIKLQNSVDGGTVWSDVKTFTQINATTVPAVQTQVASDGPGYSFWNGTTVATQAAAVYGDCWRVTYTYGGTSASGSFSVIGIDK